MSMSAHYQDQIDRLEDRIAAENRIEALELMLCECLDYFEDRSDVVDGDYGVPTPNREMRMASEIKELLGPLP